ncbi:MAG: anthranilate phosphoribosyltransferase [Spirochaetaceae bacterium]|nr:anthranilate phosphoribosyltransferase [Spirochaetaceae bacterium]|tara:strand:- start:22469 stop:23512 length:1044 start_codon:yes stop_codon:yes gene_type:complete
MKELLKRIIAGEDLTAEEATKAMTAIMSGQAGEIQTAGFLTALALKGETGTEIEAFSRSMRKAAVTWPSRSNPVILDTCGTGGDSSGIINVSTVAALVLASLGISVAKHGNRAVSSPTGSADVLEELGISMTLKPEEVAECLEKVGMCFLFAPTWHPAMKFAAPVRKALGVRTVFNLLGPITNPAPVSHQIIGVFDGRFLEPLGDALAGLGRKGACVIHSRDGLDELSIAAPTDYIMIRDGRIEKKGQFKPEDFGIQPMDISSLKVADRRESARRVQLILEGKGSDTENAMMAANAALAYHLVHPDTDLKSAYGLCLDALKQGKPMEVLEKWRSFHNNSASVTSVGG